MNKLIIFGAGIIVIPVGAITGLYHFGKKMIYQETEEVNNNSPLYQVVDEICQSYGIEKDTFHLRKINWEDDAFYIPNLKGKETIIVPDYYTQLCKPDAKIKFSSIFKGNKAQILGKVNNKLVYDKTISLNDDSVNESQKEMINDHADRLESFYKDGSTKYRFAIAREIASYNGRNYGFFQTFKYELNGLFRSHQLNFACDKKAANLYQKDGLHYYSWPLYNKLETLSLASKLANCALDNKDSSKDWQSEILRDEYNCIKTDGKSWFIPSHFHRFTNLGGNFYDLRKRIYENKSK